MYEPRFLCCWQADEVNNKLIEKLTAIQMCSYLNLSASESQESIYMDHFYCLCQELRDHVPKLTQPLGTGGDCALLSIQCGHTPPLFRRCENATPV